MAGNSFGTVFRFTTWGESHGAGIGVVVDGVPSRIALSAQEDIQPYLDRRRPGQSRYTTQRQEKDEVRIVSGLFEGRTTGTPIHLMIDNQDSRSRDYPEELRRKFRPGHADFTYWRKYGIRDHRGGGRSSARETACRVAAGAVARKVLGSGVRIRGALIQVGPYAIDRGRWDWDVREGNPFFCPDSETVGIWREWIQAIRKKGSSTGALIEVVASGVPPGLGEPVYDKLDGDLARALMTINAVKGVEVGDGFSCVTAMGEDFVDEMYSEGGGVGFYSNHAGGILGGISTGEDIVVRFAVKPTSSLSIPRRTIDIEGKNTEIATYGRHDPCIGIRAVPVGEAMVACVLADHYLRYREDFILGRSDDG